MTEVIGDVDNVIKDRNDKLSMNSTTTPTGRPVDEEMLVYLGELGLVEVIQKENGDRNEGSESGKSEDTKYPDGWEDILGSGKLVRKIIREGEPETKPKRRMVCTINCKGVLDNGEIVEQLDDFQLQVGDLEVIQGLDLGITLMNVGECCVLWIDPVLAYGEQGEVDLMIPPKSRLLYNIELIKAEDEKDDLSIYERRIIGNNKKVRGNYWYKRNDWSYACQLYRRALEYLDEVEGGITDPLPDDHDPKDTEASDAELQNLLEDRISVHNNMAAAQLKLGSLDQAMSSVQNVLRCQPNNVKALYRKALVLKMKHEFSEAMTCLQKAKNLDPNDVGIAREIKIVNTMINKNKNYEKELAKRMLQNNVSVENKDKKKKKSSSLFWASIIGSVAVGLAGIAAWRFKFF